MSKNKTVLFDFSTYKHKYNLRKIISDLERVQKFAPGSEIIAVDLAKTRMKIENELYCNLPIQYWATYNPHTLRELVNKIIVKDKSYVVISNHLDLLGLVNKKVSFLHMETDESWLYWDYLKFEDKYGYKPELLDIVNLFDKTFGLVYSLDNPENKSIVINLFSNFSDLRTAINYLKEEVIPKEKWLVDAETTLFDLSKPSEEKLLDYVSYNYSDNINGFSELLDSLDYSDKESVLASLTQGIKFKMG
jgi:hypothetical protein